MLEASLAAMGSNRFQGDNKYFFAHSVGGAWIISNESFLKDMKAVNLFENEGELRSFRICRGY